jgi:hypothetical protein
MLSPPFWSFGILSHTTCHVIPGDSPQAYERIEATFLETPATGASDGSPAPVPQSFTVQCYTALPSHTGSPGLPSKRYLHLMVNGAAEHALGAEYVTALRELPFHITTGLTMPLTPEDTPVVNLPELQRHTYQPLSVGAAPGPGPGTGIGAPAAAVWVAMGGVVFDVTSGVQGRALLQNMSGSDSTKFVKCGRQHLVRVRRPVWETS